MTSKESLFYIHDLIAKRQFVTLKNELQDRHPNDLAELISDLPENDQPIVYRLLPRDLATDTFEYFEIDMQKDLLKSMGQEEVAQILNEMSADDRTALLEEMPATAVKQLLQLLTPSERNVASTLLGYPKDSVGRLMSPDYIAVKPDWSMTDVFNHIRAFGKDKESLNVVYVTDEQGRLIDDLRIREILLAPVDTKVSDLLEDSFLSLLATDDRETAADVFRKYDRIVLPVVDSSGLLMGIVTVDDVLDIVEEEHTEDIHKFGGLEALEYTYTATPIMEMIRHRAGWLIVLFFGEMLTASAMTLFQDELNKAVILAFFVPLIISSGGNSGSQAATLIIRAMVTGEVQLNNWGRVLARETVSGLCLGTILGSIGFLRIAVWSQFTPIYGPHWLLVGITVSLTLLGVVMWGTITGSMLPFVMKRLGFDPAASSAPFVATLVDVMGLIIYFSLATLVLRGTLL